jgi:hypothetical protein
MLSNKEITNRFEVQLGTLYNWKKTKPKLFKYLQNADYNSDRNEEINVLLEHYLHKEIDKSFTQKQIEFLIASNLEIVDIEAIENIEVEFIKCEYKDLATNAEFITAIYDKLKELNIIEKYILYKKIYRYRKDKNDLVLEEFFKNYIAEA